MPRRNRNAHAFRIDADELADQADALAADLTHTYPATLRFLGEIEEWDLFTANPRPRHSSVLREHVRHVLSTYGHASLTSHKAVTL